MKSIMGAVLMINQDTPFFIPREESPHKYRTNAERCSLPPPCKIHFCQGGARNPAQPVLTKELDNIAI